MNTSEQTSTGLSPVEDGHIRNCQNCGWYKFTLTKSEICCSTCTEVFLHEDQRGNWKNYDPQNDIDQRLMMLGELFPWSIRYGVDAEGLDALKSALAGCRSVNRLTDNGGGDLTPIHCQIVMDHLGYGEVVAWFTDPSDVAMMKAACAAANAADKS